MGRPGLDSGTMGIVLGAKESRSGTGTREGSEHQKCGIHRDVIGARSERSLQTVVKILVPALPIGGNGSLVKGKLSFLWSLPRFGM